MNAIVNPIKIMSGIFPVYDIFQAMPIMIKNRAMNPGIVKPETQSAQKKYIREKNGLGHTLAHTIPTRKEKVPKSAII